MILRLKENKKLSFYQKNPIYIGEKDFDIIEVLIPPKVNSNNTEDLNFILHIVNKKGEYIHINLKKEQRSNGTVGITKIDTTITSEIQDFFLYLEMIKGEKEIIGKTNCVEITIEPLPDEDTRIVPKEEYEEIIDELTEIIQKNTNAMNRINGFQDGKSAYEIAVDNGYVGSEEEWLESLKGTDGTDGVNGVNGKDGLNGADGLSAYEIAVKNGFSGTEAEWLLSLKSTDGYSPTATVTQTLSGATISITDATGTTTANISNGSDYILTAADKAEITGTVSTVTTKNRAEVLGGAIAPEMERGSIRNTPTDYITAQSYIRTKEGFDMWLNPGAVIEMTSYTGARFKVWCTRPDGTYTQSTWLAAAYTASEFGFYQLVISKNPEEVLSDSDVADLTSRVRVTNLAVFGNREANALAPLILGIGDKPYINFTVDMDNDTAAMTIPADTLLVTTQGAVQLSAQEMTVDIGSIANSAINVVYNTGTGTVEVVNYQSHDRNKIPIAVLRRNLKYKQHTPLTVSINAPYRINGRWMNTPFAELLTPMILGNREKNYVSVDTTAHTVTFPGDTLLFVGGAKGYVSLNGEQSYTVDYSNVSSTAIKLYYNTNTGTMFATKFDVNYCCFYPLIAVMRVQNNGSGTVYPSVSINAPVVIDGKLDGYDDETKADKATTLTGYGITDAYTKTQTNEVLTNKTDVQTTTNNHAEVLGGTITPKMERGVILARNGGEYQSNNRYIRTKQGFNMWLNPGAVIGLSSYTNAQFYLRYTLLGDVFKSTSELTSDFVVKEYGFYRLVVSKKPVNGTIPELTDEDVSALISLIHVTNTSAINPSVNNTLIKQICHRGYNTVAPENTLPAFKFARKMGFTAVETDVQRTSDGVYVCLHDRSINRTARNADGTEISGTVNIDEITYAGATNYDFGILKSGKYAGTKIPTLEETLALCRSVGLKLYLELKTETLYDNISDTDRQQYVQKIIAIVNAYGMINNVTWVSLEPTLLADVKATCPAATLSYAVNNITSGILQSAVSLKNETNDVIISVDIANCQTNTRSIDNIVKICIRDGIRMGAWVASSDSETYIINAHPYVSEFTCNQLLAGNVLYNNAIN